MPAFRRAAEGGTTKLGYGLPLPVIMVLAVLFGPVAAYAHDPGRWFTHPWQAAASGAPAPPVEYVFDDSVSGPLFADVQARVVDAHTVWNNRNQGLKFASAGEAGASLPRKECPTVHPNSIHRKVMDGPGRTAASTRPCIYILNGKAHSFRFVITYDRSEPWFAQANGAPGASELDLESALVHEFGHGAGWYAPHWDQAGQAGFCPYDEDHHTMCTLMSPGTLRTRSLEPHDAHTFDKAY